MTSAILSQKLSSVLLSMRDYRKIRMLRNNNLIEKSQAIAILKDILKKQKSCKTCRLCLKPASKAIFSENQDFNYIGYIKDILRIEIYKDDGKPQHICRCCENTLRATAQLKQTAETTQWRLQQELEMVSETNEDVFQENKCTGGYFVEQGDNIVREWKCRKCKKRFQNQEEFYAHEKLRSCPRKIQQRCICEICGLELKSLKILKAHRLKHSSGPRHACPTCGYRAATKHHIAVHERCHSGARPVPCPEPGCGARFQNASNLITHRRVHLPPQFHCHLCDYSCNFKSSLKNHMEARHSTGKSHVCKMCAMAFNTRRMVLHHERRVHKRPRMSASYKKPATNDT